MVQKFTVDMTKPLLFQVGHLGEAYQEWVHQPIVTKAEPRFFASDFLEYFTKTKWWVIPLIWPPVICWYISKSVKMGLYLPQIALLVVYGIFLATLVEYIVHRFLFHANTKSYWGNTVHFLFHGFHHKYPMDELRLVLPPAATVIFLVPIWNLVRLLSNPEASPALFGGVVLGYVLYDLTHHYLHHGQPTSEMPRHLKKHHLNHHFRVHDKSFGVTSSIWDKFCGTLPRSKAVA